MIKANPFHGLAFIFTATYLLKYCICYIRRIVMKISVFVRQLCLVLIFVSTLFGCSLRPGWAGSDNIPDGWLESSLEVDDLTRWYRIYIPDPLPNNPALVLYLHGGTLSMRSLFSPLVDGTKTWLEIAESEGVVLLVPNGVNPETGDTSGNDQNWNDFRSDQAAGQSTVDDVSFILALLDEVATELPIDKSRIYVTGASNGGFMTYRLLIEASERFAAGAAFIANLPDLDSGVPLPKEPTPLMIANGTDDPLIPWDGGVVGKDRGMVISAEETVDWWVSANRADPSQLISRFLPEINPDDNCQVRMDYYPATEEGAAVLFYAILGGGHTMPSIDHAGLDNRLTRRLFGSVCREVEGVQLAWDFFTGRLDLEP
jgi:polyhydroxybutyrate depolymerase